MVYTITCLVTQNITHTTHLVVPKLTPSYQSFFFKIHCIYDTELS